MKVYIKKLAVDMEIKNKGVELEVRDSQDQHLGDLYVTKAGLTWCRGRTTRRHGKKMPWSKFIADNGG